MSLATQEGISVALDYRYFGAVNDTAAVPAVRAIKASGLKAVIVYLNEQVRNPDSLHTVRASNCVVAVHATLLPLGVRRELHEPERGLLGRSWRHGDIPD